MTRTDQIAAAYGSDRRGRVFDVDCVMGAEVMESAGLTCFYCKSPALFVRQRHMPSNGVKEVALCGEMDCLKQEWLREARIIAEFPRGGDERD